MASYSLEFSSSVIKDLRSIPNRDVQRILQRINALKIEPRPPNCQKLSGQPIYRIRQGAYRVLYEIKAEALIVLVIKVGHRKSVYQRIASSKD